MNEPHGGVTDDPRNTEIFIAGLSYWTSHRDLDTFNSDTLVSSHLYKILPAVGFDERTRALSEFDCKVSGLMLDTIL